MGEAALLMQHSAPGSTCPDRSRLLAGSWACPGYNASLVPTRAGVWAAALLVSLTFRSPTMATAALPSRALPPLGQALGRVTIASIVQTETRRAELGGATSPAALARTLTSEPDSTLPEPKLLLSAVQSRLLPAPK
ncbi:GRIP1-associated protein 1 [Platysternon megacephalum]|uniref:GRIP1-associated protein 1 n=1 Tax=Platysternon megacephalum TaxID=55544 RepID=A0A4D9DRT5_9SAUR|nr:GRIP1-associated protein 1 [Platysternon megacephalum]